MYLLDTNVVSELRRQRPHPAVEDWIRPIPAEKLLLSAVTVGEIQAGIEITREQDRSKAKELEVWLDQMIASYQILVLDAQVMREWARLMHQEIGHADSGCIDCRNRRSPPFDRGNPECPGFRTVRRRDTQSISSSGIAAAPAKVSGGDIAALSGRDAGTAGRRSLPRPRFTRIRTTRPRAISRHLRKKWPRTLKTAEERRRRLGAPSPGRPRKGPPGLKPFRFSDGRYSPRFEPGESLGRRPNFG